MDIYVGRQPIFDTAGNIYGYELLYRDGEINSFPNENPDRATMSVLINTFMSIGVEKVSGDSRSFINFTENLLLNNVVKLNPKFVVIEVLETVNITPNIITSLRALKKQGFKIALDDFILHSQYDTDSELFKLVNIIKVDFMNTTINERIVIEDLAKRYSHIVLLAEKVETERQYEVARELGYKLFQGYFFAKPEIIKSKDIPKNYALYFHIIEMLNHDTASIDQISELISRDVSLSYKILRYINSLAFSIPNNISSIKQALLLMGLDEGRKWMQVLLLHSLGREEGQGRVRALVEFSLIRAKVCELLARHNGKSNHDEFFLAAMFSLLDVIIKRDLNNILTHLPLSKEIKQTLLGKETEISPYLSLAIALERFDLDGIHFQAEQLGVEESVLMGFSQQAYLWLNKMD